MLMVDQVAQVVVLNQVQAIHKRGLNGDLKTLEEGVKKLTLVDNFMNKG
jgi:hypothetical protein